MLSILQYIINSLYFFLHQVTQHLMVCIKIISNNCCRSMLTVSSTKCIVDISICIASQSLGKFFLRSLHGFLCIIVCRVFLINTYRFSLLFRIEAKVLEQQSFTRLQSSSSLSSLCTIRSKLNRNTKSFSNSVNNLTQRHLRINLSFWFTHV